jgi:hypothetical protein
VDSTAALGARLYSSLARVLAAVPNKALLTDETIAYAQASRQNADTLEGPEAVP